MGASGLMWIIPGTATRTVGIFSVPGYNGPEQLLDPEMNISINTNYLQYAYQQFGSNRIFSSAAYSTGFGRVRAWLDSNARRIGVVTFVKSIPFSEARGYMGNMLTYDTYYRYFTGIGRR